MANIAIVGGGLSGLSIAYRLKQFAPSLTVTVLETHGRAGGIIATEDHQSFRVETGPNGFLDRTPFLPSLVHDLGLSDRLIAASEGSRKNRYLFVRNKLQRLPRGPLELVFSPLLTIRGKWRLLTEPWRKRPDDMPRDESVAAFVTRRAGKQAADVFADALVTGIHGGDPNQLSVSAAFPRLPVLEREAGSIVRGFMRAGRQRKKEALARGDAAPGPQKMWSFREGLGVLIDGLVQALGPIITTGVIVKSISESRNITSWKINGNARQSWSADAVVLACPAYEQAAILADLDPALAREISGIPYNRIAVVALGYHRSQCPGSLDGFGYIAPQNTRRDVLGVQWCSSIFPDRAPHGHVLWRALCGGVHRGEMVDWDDSTLAKAVHEEIKLAMGVQGEPVFQRIIRWPRAIPQYVVGHLERLTRIDALTAKHPGLFLAGNAYHGVSMGDCAEQGEVIAARVAGYLASSESYESRAGGITSG